MWGAPVSLAAVTTTSTRQTRKPATRRRGGASGASTTRRGSTASCAGPGTTGTPCGRTVEVSRGFPLPAFRAISTAFSSIGGMLFFGGLLYLGKHLSRVLFDKRKMRLTPPHFFLVTSLLSGRTVVSRCGSGPEGGNRKGSCVAVSE